MGGWSRDFKNKNKTSCQPNCLLTKDETQKSNIDVRYGLCISPDSTMLRAAGETILISRRLLQLLLGSEVVGVST